MNQRLLIILISLLSIAHLNASDTTQGKEDDAFTLLKASEEKRFARQERQRQEAEKIRLAEEAQRIEREKVQLKYERLRQEAELRKDVRRLEERLDQELYYGYYYPPGYPRYPAYPTYSPRSSINVQYSGRHAQFGYSAILPPLDIN